MSRLRTIAYHPIFFAAYPVLALVAYNLGQVKPGIGIRALVVSILGTVILWLILMLFYKDWQLSALLCSVMVLLFYSYGQLYEGLKPVVVFGTSLGRHRFLAPLWLLLFALAVWSIRKYRASARRLTQPLNLVSAFLLLFPIIQITLFHYRPQQADAGLVQVEPELVQQGLRSAPNGAVPDVYYIILDAYTNQRTLQEVFDFDNSPFLSQLEDRGFTVAECSQSNYAQTELSFASSLNLAYLDDFDLDLTESSTSRESLWPLIRRSGVRQLLEEQGYQTVAFETGYYWSELEDADLYLSPAEISESGIRVPAGLSAFEATLLRSTLAWMIIDQAPGLPKFLVRDLDRSAEAHYQRVTFTLDALQEMAAIPGPKFVFAHIISPHSPFVFGPEGEFVDHESGESRMEPEVYRTGYVTQIEVLNTGVLQIVDRLIEESETPPVIILQGDHGPEEGSAQARMSILNAYYLQGRRSSPIENTTSPVNSFRIAFNTVFGTRLPLLKDVSYFSTYVAPYDFTIVPNRCVVESDR